MRIEPDGTRIADMWQSKADGEAVGSKDVLAVSFGGGTNSTAMLCGFRERGIKPDLIIFADTGAEMPHTYEQIGRAHV